MRVLIILLGIMVGSVFANTLYLQPDGTYGPERTFPDDKMIKEIQERLSKYDVAVMWEVTQFLHRLPRRPWPEPLKVILLQIINDYHIDEKHLEWNQEYGHLDNEGEITSNVSDMASWQDDTRFIPYLAQFMGTRARESLIRLGEPAFEVFIKALARDGWHSQDQALFAFENWLENNVTFLNSGQKREQLNEELRRIAQPQNYWNQAIAVRLLRYFNDENVIRILQYLSSDEKPVMIHAPFPDRVRKEALESLNYLQGKEPKPKESIQLAQDYEGNIPEFLRVDAEYLTFENTVFAFDFLKRHLDDFRTVVETLGRYSNIQHAQNYHYIKKFETDIDTLIIKLPVDTLLQYDCMSWLINNLGIPNSLVSVAGHRLVSEERILKLQIENMELKGGSAETIKQLKLQHQKIKEERDHFLMTNSYFD